MEKYETILPLIAAGLILLWLLRSPWDRGQLPRIDKTTFRDIVRCMERAPEFVQWCTQQTQRGVFGVDEVWIECVPAWIRRRDCVVHQPLKGHFYPTEYQRWRLRRAFRKLDRAKPNPLPLESKD